MSIIKLALLASMPFMAFAARQRRAATDEFELFGYGPTLGGPGLFFADGYAYIGDPSLSNSSDAATVICNDYEFIGTPNTTELSNSTGATWSDVHLFVPGANATDSRVGFVSNTTSTGDIRTDCFFFYGQTATVVGTDGTLSSLWTGLPVGDTGVYALYWNDTSAGQIQLTLRSLGPSNPSGSVPIATLTPAASNA
ncbi:hypothetical protein P154DRAFT_439044 [Amniculicola lignicola CBS 123094]|uniref:Uncharacterized protein n=1 Tax=Amniculicola lignicola CBS 123094 TaxID=1392246 RepID=A0A6A5WCG9_9PLEO|nr:hypothetical protein P154DRAFT_439044 [Amniculicola lignicola CBS 123094]